MHDRDVVRGISEVADQEHRLEHARVGAGLSEQDPQDLREIAVALDPLIRSFERGEDWWWCYADEVFFEIAGAPPVPSHP